MSEISLIRDHPQGTWPQTSLITTKFYIPPIIPTLVARPHLLQRLNEGVQKKLTLICAPAGFGKTSLLAQWCAGLHTRHSDHPISIAWVSLEAGEDDPQQFWRYVLTALHSFAPQIGEEILPLLQLPDPPSIELLLTRVINTLAVTREEIVMVLDDYHVIQAAAIHQSLTFLLEHLPPHLHLILAGRSQPPLPLARWRSRGQVSELLSDALRFSVEEAQAFLQKATGRSWPAEAVVVLFQRTEGWIAGLQLAALSLKGRSESTEFIRAFAGSSRYVLDYLSEEVLRQQPEAVQTFLLQTSILDQLSALLCDAVTGQHGSQAMLEHLEQANLFVVPLDDEQNWYRYHHLFRELLHHRLRRSSPELVPQLHQRAADWYEQQGLPDPAVKHALAASEYGQAMRLMEQAAPSMLHQERNTLRQWIEALPAEQLKASPRLCIAYAVLLAANFQLGTVERYLEWAETSLQERPKDELAGQVQQMLGEIDSIRADLACNRGELPQAIALCHQALERLPRERVFLRGSINLTLGVAHVYHGEMMAARDALIEALELSQAAGNVYNVLHSLCRLGWMYMMQGQSHQPYHSFQRALHLVETHPQFKRSLHVSLIYIFMGEILREWNELDRAAHMLKQGIEICEQNGFDTGSLGAGYTILAQVKQAQGAMDEAIALMQKLEQIIQLHGKKILFESRISLCQVRLWIAQGKLESAIQWKQENRSILCTQGSPSHLYEIQCLALAQVQLAQSRAGRYLPAEHPLQEALHLLEQARSRAEVSGRMGHVVDALVLQALVLQAMGNLPQAIQALQEALVLAEPEGYVRTFVDEGPPMAQLLQQLVASGGAWPYVTRLLEVLGIPTNQQQDTHSLQSCVQTAPLESLSEREVEVLRLLGSSRSNAEIAQTLVVSMNTVKTHLQHIYGKLGVINRTQAVARARELHLLSS